MKLLQGLIRLKTGIETNDKKAIEEAFVLITGEVVEFPSGCSGSCRLNKDVKQETSDPEIYSMVTVDEPTPTPENVPVLTKDFDLDFTMNKSGEEPSNSNGSSSEQKKSSAFENKFSPDLEIDDEEGYDKINDAVKPVPRTRKAHKKVEVFCQDCKNTISVDPMFKKEPYYCDLIKLGQKCPNSK